MEKPTVLVGLAKELSAAPLTREMDVLLSTGEQVTIALLSIALQERGLGGAIIYWRAGTNFNG